MAVRNRMDSAVLDRILVGVGLMAAWFAASAYFGQYWASSPLRVADRIVDWIASGELLYQSKYTLGALAVGIACGAIPGAVLPFLLRRMPVADAILAPYFVGGYSMPKLALVPLFIVWFGVGIWPKVALVAAVCFFISFFNAQAGIRSVNPQLIRMAEISGANEASVGRKVILPAALPFIFSGIRVAIPFAVGGMVVAEMLSANRGMGYLIQSASMNFDATGSFAGIVVVAIYVATISAVLSRVERKIFGWRPKAFSLAAKEAI